MKKIEKLEKRITDLEDFRKSFVPIECEYCKRTFMVGRKNYESFKKQKLKIYCPFTRRIAKRWDEHERI